MVIAIVLFVVLAIVLAAAASCGKGEATRFVAAVLVAMAMVSDVAIPLGTAFVYDAHMAEITIHTTDAYEECRRKEAIMNTNIINLINETASKNGLTTNLLTATEDCVYLAGIEVGDTPLKDEVSTAKQILIASVLDSANEFRDGEKLAYAILGKRLMRKNTVRGVVLSTYYAIRIKEMRDETLLDIAVDSTWQDMANIVSAYTRDTEALLSAVTCNGKMKAAIKAMAKDPNVNIDIDVLDIVEAFQKRIDQVLRCNKHRGEHTARIQTVATSMYAMRAEFVEQDVVDKDGKPMANEDGTPMVKLVPDGDINLDSDHVLSKTVTQSDNRLFECIVKDYEERGYDLNDVELPMVINVAMCGDHLTKRKLEGAAKDNKYIEENVLPHMETIATQKNYEDMMSSALFEHGFYYGGVHYAYLDSTQAQIRGGKATFVIDLDNENSVFMARMYYVLTGGRNAATIIANIATGASEKEIADMLLKEMQDNVSKFRGKAVTGKDIAEMYKVSLSKVLGRFGLSASSAVDIKEVFDNNDSPIFNYYRDILEKAKILVLASDGEKVEITTQAKTVELEKMAKADKNGKTHQAKIVVKNDVKFKEVVDDGGFLVDLILMAAYSLALHYITEEQAEFFKEHWIENNEYDYDTDILYNAAESGDETAIKLKEIILAMRTVAQSRLTGGDTEGFGIKGAGKKYSIKGDEKLRALGYSDYGMIIPDSCVKFYKDGTEVSAFDMRICNTNKGHDLLLNMSRMSAQYVGAMKLTADEVIEIADICINSIVSALDVNKKNSDELIDSLISLGIIGDKKEFTMFNQARELVKSNPKMRNDARFLAYLRQWAGKLMSEIASGKIPVKGDYLFSVCDPKASINHWFADEMKAKGIAKHKTLFDYAKEQVADEAREQAEKDGKSEEEIKKIVEEAVKKVKDVYYVNGFKGLIGVFRSPANSRFEAQRGNAYDIKWYWLFNDCLVFAGEEGNWRKLGGSDFDGDKVLVILDIDDVNGILIRGIAMDMEVKTDLDVISKVVKADANKCAVTVDNIVALMPKISRKSMIGQISKWSAAQLAMATHLEEVKRISLANGCTAVVFVVPAIESKNWVNSTHDDSDEMKKLDALHAEMVKFVSENHTSDKFAHTLDASKTDTGFEGYVIKGKTLFVEGYVEVYKTKVGDIVPKKVKDENGHKQLCGLCGRYAVSELDTLIAHYLELNEINSVASGVEIDATNNGFSSFFHEQAGFMAHMELFRDILKNKEINELMAYSAYINIGTLGTLFNHTMSRWNDVMSLISEDKAVDMTDYMCMLIGKEQIDALKNKKLDFAAIKKNYSDEMNDIQETYCDDDDEDERMEAIRDLMESTKTALCAMVRNSECHINMHSMALACYLIGGGKSFSFLFIDELRELLENDPTAIGIVKLPKYFDDTTMVASVKEICGRAWIVIDDTTTAEPSKLFKAVKTNHRGALRVRIDENDEHYVYFRRKADENVTPGADNTKAPNERLLPLTVDDVEEVQKKAKMSIVLNREIKCDLKALSNTKVAGIMRVHVKMNPNGTINILWYNKKNGKYCEFGKQFAIAIPSPSKFVNNLTKACLVNYTLYLDTTKASISNDKLSILGLRIANIYTEDVK